MDLNFVARAELAGIEWDEESGKWLRPQVDAETLRTLTERSTAEGMLRLTVHTALIVGSAFLTLFAARYHLLLAVPPFLFYAFLIGFLNGVEHEMRHKILFSRQLNWFNDAVYFLIHVLFRQGSRYQTVSHRTHHRYTMVRGVDPETPFPDQITRRWVKRTLGGLLLEVVTLGVPSFLKAVIALSKRIAGVKDQLMRDQCSEKDIRFIRIESLAILVINIAVIVIGVWFRRWDLILLIIVGPQVGGAIVAFWWMTEHIGMMYNTNDQRICTRGVKVSPFVKFLYGGLDEHVEHHLYPAVPSRNLAKLRESIDWPIQERIGVVACWREIYEIARHQETNPDDVFLPIEAIAD